jgi:hypothetical protein
MTGRIRIIILVLLPTLLLLTPENSRASQESLFHRGVGVHRPLNWASVLPPDRSQYAWPPFASPAHDVPDALIEQIRRSGFDFVRLTVDPGPFLQMTGDKRDRLDAILIRTIRRFRSRDLGVIVNFHSNSQVAQYEPERILTNPNAEIFLAYRDLVAQVAHALGELNDPRVAFEPVNEPPAGYDSTSAARWQGMMEVLYRAARKEASRLPLVVTGAQGGSRRGLVLLDPAQFIRDSSVLYSFHYYEPHILTHQGVTSSQPQAIFWRDLRGLPYPARKEDLAQAIRAAESRIDVDPSFAVSEKPRVLTAARTAITRYFDEGWDHERIGAAFADIAQWARGHGIKPHQIVLGEFGATRIGTDNDPARLRWLADVRCAAEEHGFLWSVWELNGTGGMAIVDTADPARLDNATLGALGIGGARPGKSCHIKR